jgi:hypothetical protein
MRTAKNSSVMTSDMDFLQRKISGVYNIPIQHTEEEWKVGVEVNPQDFFLPLSLQPNVGIVMQHFVKNSVFRDVALCRSYVNRRFGGTYRLLLEGRKIREQGTSVSRWL